MAIIFIITLRAVFYMRFHAWYCSEQTRSSVWTLSCYVCWHACPESSPWTCPSCWSLVAGIARKPQSLTLEIGSCKGGWDLRGDLSSIMMRWTFNLFYLYESVRCFDFIMSDDRCEGEAWSFSKALLMLHDLTGPNPCPQMVQLKSMICRCVIMELVHVLLRSLCCTTGGFIYISCPSIWGFSVYNAILKTGLTHIPNTNTKWKWG